MKHCASVSALARELGIRRKWLYEWKKAAERKQHKPAGRTEPSPPAEQPLQRRLAELEALTARQSLELDFFKGALRRIEERRRKHEPNTVPESTSKSDQ